MPEKVLIFDEINMARSAPSVPFNQEVICYYRDSEVKCEQQNLHYHNIMEVCYVLEGCCSIIINDHNFIAHPGELVIINPTEMHAVNYGVQPTKLYVIAIDTNCCEEMGIDFGNDKIKNIIKNKKACNIVRKMYSECTSGRRERLAMCYSLAIQFMIYLRKNHMCSAEQEKPFSDKKLEIVHKSISYMQKHYAERVLFEDMAQELGYSKYYISHIFSEVTGKTAAAYLQVIRCNQARQMLKSSKDNINKIADLCGFQDASYFSHTYKKVMGCSPISDKVGEAN